MNKLQILIITLLITLSICVFVNLQTVEALTPIVSVPTLNPSSSIILGSSVTTSVTVSGIILIPPTGSVTFQYSIDGSIWINIGSAVALDNGGSATSIPFTPTVSNSNYQFRANYSGDGNYDSRVSSPSANLTVNKATATVSAASFVPVSPITYGSSVTVSVSISGPNGVTAPTGNVQFQVKIGAGSYTNFGSVVALSSGSASTLYNPLTATTYSFRAVYQGDSNYNSGTISSASGTLTVNRATATVAAPVLSPSGSTTAGTTVSISVDVSGSGAIPTGTATFQVNFEGGGWNNIGSSVSLNGGSASTIYIPQNAGSYQFQAIYSGNGNYNSSTSSVVSLTVTSILEVNVGPEGPLAMDVGQTQVFTVTVSGGIGTKSYQWYFDGAALSGQTASNYTYTDISGLHTLYVRVTDSAPNPVTVQSNTVSVTGNSAPTVSITPAGPLTMNIGQVQVFTATSSGGSGVIHYQWYLGDRTVGTDNSTYSYTATETSASITCKVTDSAYVPFTSPPSNAVIITSNPALVAPTVSASPSTINQGQTSSLTSTSVSTGTSPYTYQWLQRVPGGNYAVVGSNSASFSFITSGATTTGIWSFILQVTDTAGAAVNSSAVSVAVNIAPLDHFVFSSVGVQTAGKPFNITITAKNPFNSTLTNYSGTNILNVSTGTISPATTGTFINGVWTGSVTVTGAGSGIWIITSGSGMSGTSGTFTINPSALDHFVISDISGQTAGSAFNITVTAKDIYNNTVTNYVGTPSLTYSAGTISPTNMNPFVNGIGTTSVLVAVANSNAEITVADNGTTGVSNSFTVSLAPTPSPSQTISPTVKPTPTVTSNPSITSSPTPSPTPNQLKTNVFATTESGAQVYISMVGNITNSQISDVAITTNNSTTTTISFKLTGENGNSGYCNMTIPKNAIPFGTIPVLFVDGLRGTNQGYTQDVNSFYVWFTTEFSTHEMKIQFAGPQIQSITFGPVLAVGIAIPEIILIYAVIAVRRLKRKPENA